MQELLKRGLAVHHSGILPILKEVRYTIATIQSNASVYSIAIISLKYFVDDRDAISGGIREGKL